METNLGIGILPGDIARSISEPVLEGIAICGPRISRSLGFLCAGIGHQEMGRGALAMRGATGGGTGLPEFLPTSHFGKFLPSLILVTSAEPENSAGEFGGCCIRLMPDVALSLLGGPEKPLALQGRTMMQSLGSDGSPGSNAIPTQVVCAKHSARHCSRFLLPSRHSHGSSPLASS